MTKSTAGLLTIVLLVVFAYFGFTKANPFASPFELEAVFRTANNLKPNSPVRIAGVEVGKVKKVEALEGTRTGGARVFMELKDTALPIHKDAELKVRPRIFLEGNFFIDIQPGSPSEPAVEDGDVIPMNQTSAPVQLGDVLASLQSDTREDLKTLLKEYSKGLAGGGARGFNQSIRYWEPAYRNAALANDASLGEEPTRDLQRVLKGQQQLAEALIADEGSLKDLVTNFNVTAGAFAREDVALSASIPELSATLREGQPALAALNDALPTLRVFAREALPGVRSSGPTLRASLPFIRQARALVSRRELRGLAAVLRRRTPAFVRLSTSSIPVLEQSRGLSACTNKVLVPFIQSRIPNAMGPDANGNNNQQVRHQLQRGFPGLSGESRLSDGNNQFFHTSAVALGPNVQPVPPPDIDQPPPRRPDVPCETQEPPNLNAPGAPSAALGGKKYGPSKFNTKKLAEAGKLMREFEKKRSARMARLAKLTARKQGLRVK